MTTIQTIDQVPGSCFRHVYEVEDQYAAQAMRMATLLTGSIDAKSQHFDLQAAQSLVQAHPDMSVLGMLDHTIHGLPEVLKPLLERNPPQTTISIFGGSLAVMVGMSEVISELMSGAVRSPLTNEFISAMDNAVVSELDSFFGNVVSPQSAQSMRDAILDGFTNVVHHSKSAWIFYSDDSGNKASYQYNTFIATQSTPGYLIGLPIALTITVDVEHEEVLGFTTKSHQSFDVRVQALKISQPLTEHYTIAGHPLDLYPDQNCAIAVAMTPAQYQAVCNQMVASGYIPIYIDGSTHYGQGFINVVFSVWNGPAWYAFHQRDAQNFWATYEDAVQRGYVLMQLSSYVDAGVQYFAGLFVQYETNNARAAGHPLISVTEDQYQQDVDVFVTRSYRVVCQSRTVVDGETLYSVLLKQDPIAWEAQTMETSDQYQLRSEEMYRQNWRLTNLDCSIFDGDSYDTRIASVFNPVPDGIQQTMWRHHVSESDLRSLIHQTNSNGYRPTLVSGYQYGSEIRYAAAWEK